MAPRNPVIVQGKTANDARLVIRQGNLRVDTSFPAPIPGPRQLPPPTDCCCAESDILGDLANVGANLLIFFDKWYGAAQRIEIAPGYYQWVGGPCGSANVSVATDDYIAEVLVDRCGTFPPIFNVVNFMRDALIKMRDLIVIAKQFGPLLTVPCPDFIRFDIRFLPARPCETLNACDFTGFPDNLRTATERVSECQQLCRAHYAELRSLLDDMFLRGRVPLSVADIGNDGIQFRSVAPCSVIDNLVCIVQTEIEYGIGSPENCCGRPQDDIFNPFGCCWDDAVTITGFEFVSDHREWIESLTGCADSNCSGEEAFKIITTVTQNGVSTLDGCEVVIPCESVRDASCPCQTFPTDPLCSSSSTTQIEVRIDLNNPPRVQTSQDQRDACRGAGCGFVIAWGDPIGFTFGCDTCFTFGVVPQQRSQCLVSRSNCNTCDEELTGLCVECDTGKHGQTKRTAFFNVVGDRGVCNDNCQFITCPGDPEPPVETLFQARPAAASPSAYKSRQVNGIGVDRETKLEFEVRYVITCPDSGITNAISYDNRIGALNDTFTAETIPAPVIPDPDCPGVNQINGPAICIRGEAELA